MFGRSKDKKAKDAAKSAQNQASQSSASNKAMGAQKIPDAKNQELRDSLNKVASKNSAENLTEKPAQKSAQKPNKQEKKSNPSKLKVKNWYANRYQSIIIQRNILLLLTLFSMIAVTVAVIFVRNIMSSKSLEPYVIEVEKKTGVPVVVEQLSSKHLTGDEMIRKYFINKFIHAASGYDPKTYKIDSNVVRLLSVPGVYRNYRNRINAKELGPKSEIKLRIKSVQFPSSQTAQIRIVRVMKIDGFDTVEKNEIITMNFYFANLDLSLEERLVNPLGFQVSRYIIAEEIFNY